MNKTMRIICIILCVGLIMGLGYVVIRKIKKYPDEVEYSSLRAFADDGMYYIKRNVLYFLDSKTGKSVVVCNKVIASIIQKTVMRIYLDWDLVCFIMKINYI